MKQVTVQALRRAMIAVADEIIINEPYLTEVDTIIGDGDHGTGMKRGFTALKKRLENTAEFKTVQELFKTVGLELVKTMGGASGVIFGTMFISGLEDLGEADTVDVGGLAAFFTQGLAGIQKRGKAELGQKTMLDALAPAAVALKEASDKGDEIESALERAYEAAKGGVEATKQMRSRVGRSKNFHDATIGHPDPGAISTSLIFKALYESISGTQAML